MPRPRPSHLLAATAALAGHVWASTGSTGAWHNVDVQEVLCPGSRGWTLVNFTSWPGGPSAVHNPNIFTVFRTDKQAVTLHFEVHDAAGKLVANQSSGISLQNLMSTSSTAPPRPTLPGGMTMPPYPSMPPLATLPPAAEMPTSPPLPSLTVAPLPAEAAPPQPPLLTTPPPTTEAAARRLSSRRRSGGGYSYSSPRRRSFSYSSPRRRSSPTYYSPRRRSSPAYYSPRRRSPVPAGSPRRRSPGAVTSPRRRGGFAPGGSTTSPRRRTANFNAPRRRGYVPAGVRRRTSGYGGSSYQNQYSPAAGHYGYGSQQAAYHNYGGRPPMHTPYGYSGAHAYSGHSGAKIAMALGGGLVAGVAASYMFNHYMHPHGFGGMDLRSLSCQSGVWSGNCHDCTSMFAATSCYTQLSPSFDAARDDLMDTGFVPADYTFPLTVRVTGVQGASFQPVDICPPPGWTPDMNATWHPKANSSIFLALTAMQEFAASPADGGADGGGSGSGGWSSLATAFIFLGIVVCGCLVPCAMCLASKSRRKHRDGWSSSSDSDDEMPRPQMVAPLPGQQAMYNYAGAGAGYHAGTRGGFMSTASPNGNSWEDRLRGQRAAVNGMGMVDGPWGECLAWAKVYELQNPGWENDPQYRIEGPCGQVIEAMTQASGGDDGVREAADRLEEECTRCAETGRPLPLINYRM